MSDREQTQDRLTALKARQPELDQLLAAAREDVELNLDSVIRATYREKHFIKEKGNIADGEIQVPWDLLQDSIGRLRRAQKAAADHKRQIEEMIQELADDELWF